MTDKAVHIALYPSDWLAGTRGLTPAETGVYITLVCMMYERQAPLPFDQPRLARMCNCPAGTFKKILATLIDEGKIIETPEGIWQNRVAKELTAAQEAIESASERGRNAVAARWAKAKGESDPRENAKVKRQSVGQQGQSHTAEKGNEINGSNLHPYYQSNTNQNQSQNIDDDDDTRARKPDGLMASVCAAAGRDFGSLNGKGTRFGMAPAEVEALRRWQADLGLTPDQIIASVQHQAARMRSPPNSLTYFTPGLQQLAAELSAPPLEIPAQPTGGMNRDPATARDPRAAAASDSLRRSIHDAARMRRTAGPDMP